MIPPHGKGDSPEFPPGARTPGRGSQPRVTSDYRYTLGYARRGHSRWFTCPLLPRAMDLAGAVLDEPLASVNDDILSATSKAQELKGLPIKPGVRRDRPDRLRSGRAVGAIGPHLSHLAPGTSVDRRHLALAAAQGAHAAPHFATFFCLSI